MSLRFYAGKQILQQGESILLDEGESHHLLKVMRLHAGADIRVFTQGFEHQATVVGREGHQARVAVGEQCHGTAASLAVGVTAAIPWIRGGKTEVVVQKLTELGITTIVIYHAVREVVKADSSKLERLQRTAIEACKQCERADVPELLLADTAAHAVRLAEIPTSQCFLLHERSNANLLSTAIKHEMDSGRTFRTIAFMSGPEGGFHPSEVETLRNIATSVSLGPRILRAETAPVVAAAIVLSAFGEM
jgi:16S rRNA (uracil1498-N3)-methyltransferase